MARFLREHHSRLRVWRPDDVLTRSLRLLTEDRRHWVDQRTAAGNRLLQQLKEVYPLALGFLGKQVYADRFLALLAKFPAQRDLQRASPRKLVEWLTRFRRVADNPPADPRLDPRVVALQQALPLVTDEAVLRHGRLAVKSLVTQLQQLNEIIAEYEREITALLAQHPDAQRTFYVHQERRNVHSVGEVRLLFSTAKQKLAKATPDDVKVLMTNSHRSVREVIELYSLRWQIELFFKELKSTLGFHQDQFQKFDAVESWTELALTAFLYLEGYRARQLARRGLTDKERTWWRHQRTNGLVQAVRQAAAHAELEYFRDRLHTPGGIARLKRLIQSSFAPEYQAAL